MKGSDSSRIPRFGLLVTTHCLVENVFLHKSVDGCLKGCQDSLTVHFCCLLVDVSGKLSKFLLESFVVSSLVLYVRRGEGDLLAHLSQGSWVS